MTFLSVDMSYFVAWARCGCCFGVCFGVSCWLMAPKEN